MSSSKADHVRARDALSRYAWQEAYDLLVPARDQDAADAGELADFAEAAWWLGRFDESREARERAYHIYERAGDWRNAVRIAWWFYDEGQYTGRPALSSAWAARAHRLIEGKEECAEHGFVLIIDVERAHGRGDLDDAADLAQQLVAIGRTFGDADVEATGLQALGHVRIAQARVDEGIAAFDEAMLLAMEGRLDAMTTGNLYCSAISACEHLGDLRRAAEWTEVGVEWTRQHPLTVFPGLCRIHRAGVLHRRGAWADAENEARRACDDLLKLTPPAAAMGFHEIGEIRRRLGDLEGAEAAFRRVEELGSRPQPGLAMLRLAQGKVEGAAKAIARALAEEAHNPLARAKLLPAQVQIAIAASDIETASGAAAELAEIAERYGSSGLRAQMLLARGRLELVTGVSTAGVTLRRALQQWQELNVPYEIATTRLLMGIAAREAGDDDEARACFEAAATIFGQLGAQMDVRRLDEVRGRADALPAGLTEREAEVLRLVASGQTNKDIAAALGLSPKTVDRHLANIFAKTGVASRAAATAWAFEHGIVGHGS